MHMIHIFNNICFYGEIWIIFPKLFHLPLLTWSTVIMRLTQIRCQWMHLMEWDHQPAGNIAVRIGLKNNIVTKRETCTASIMVCALTIHPLEGP